MGLCLLIQALGLNQQARTTWWVPTWCCLESNFNKFLKTPLSFKSLEEIARVFYHRVQFNSFQSLSSIRLFVIPWTPTCQTSLSITNSQSLLTFMAIKSVMSSNHLILFSSCPQSFPGSFPMSQFFASGGQSIVASASLSVLPMNIQDWFPLGWTGWISL